ncbi:hypothetical protein BDP55DRAFT_687469 [Colletotrichum godetiae]|uniref:Uncharacterized protein n=1 Tax=Colletotrichum godetiae TaxID=1209918 RepID=A0AAJ0EM10_9PEZI|nr:uncharacterized protein BDP55DRAFT_687469 [Colletotrichum godetiae]KAK1656941.1 hypothetical protein BDP55DRAFT_687469 [Colletotrichum godetiae]
MAPVSSDKIVFTYDKKAKEKVRKCGASGKRKAVQLGEGAQVFSAVIHFNPTYGQLDGAVHVPDGQSIPDVNRFLAELVNGMHGCGRRRRVSRRRRKRLTSEPGQSPAEIGDSIEVGEVGSSVRGTPDTVGDEDATAKEVTSGEADAPYEVEADDGGAAVFCGTVSGFQQDEADVGEPPSNPAKQGHRTDLAPLNHDVEGIMGDFIMSDADTAGSINAVEEGSFLGLPEIDLRDLFEMEACASTFLPVGDSELGKQGQSSDAIPDQERSEVETSGETREGTAAAGRGAFSHQTKVPQTRTIAAARAYRPDRSSFKIHRFFCRVSQRIRQARYGGELHTEHV